MINPLLAKLEAITDLSTSDRHAIEMICTDTRTIGGHKDIVTEGEKPEHIHIMLDGCAALQDAAGRRAPDYRLPSSRRYL
jgi:hypothetical protein